MVFGEGTLGNQSFAVLPDLRHNLEEGHLATFPVPASATNNNALSDSLADPFDVHLSFGVRTCVGDDVYIEPPVPSEL